MLRNPAIHLTAVARGEQAADRLIRGAVTINVYSGELLEANVAIAEGRIAYVGPREPAANEIIDAGGAYLAPAWIEPHAHPWIFYNPISLLEGVLPGGTTTLFNDDLVFVLQGGPQGFIRFLEAVGELPVRYRWLVRMASQSEAAGEVSEFGLDELKPLLARPDVAGTAEMTRWPQVFRGDPAVLETIAYAHLLGKRADGHTAGASYEKLNAVVAGGIDACHEAIRKQEILDRLRLGLWTILRHSSLRPDIPELARAITENEIDTRRLMVTVDGASPRFIAEGGFIDEALRQLVAAGVPPVTAIQMATINPATYYHMDGVLGGIAPGRFADLVFLPDLESFRPSQVMFEGRVVARGGKLAVDLPRVDWDALGMRPAFAIRDFPLEPEGRLPVIEFISNAITRASGFQSQPRDGDILAVLLDKAGRWATRAWVRGFLPRLTALATTYNTATDLLVMGRDPAAMRLAAESVIRNSGGIAFAERDGVTWEFALPITGVMTPGSFADAVQGQREIEQRVRAAGFAFGDILYALLFLCCDFLPGLRLTPRGVLNVKTGEIVG